MAQYLLNADDEAMAAWKANAKLRGVPFSEWLRLAAAAYAAEAGLDAVVRRPPRPANDLAGPARPDFKPDVKKPQGRR